MSLRGDTRSGLSSKMQRAKCQTKRISKTRENPKQLQNPRRLAAVRSTESISICKKNLSLEVSIKAAHAHYHDTAPLRRDGCFQTVWNASLISSSEGERMESKMEKHSIDHN